MESRLTDVWVYLSQTPLLWLTATLAVYQAAVWLSQRLNNHPLLNPVLLSVAVLVGVLLLSSTSYEQYFDGAQFVHFLLGPATVSLAIPLYAQAAKLRRMFFPLLVSLLIGSSTAILLAWSLGQAFGLAPEIIRSMLPKSVTTPIAMGIAEQIGGIPSFTAVLVILTGIIGSSIAIPLFHWLGIRDPAARGFAMGLASHGMGTARAFQSGEEAGAFSGLAMGLNGAVTTLLIPLFLWLLSH